VMFCRSEMFLLLSWTCRGGLFIAMLDMRGVVGHAGV
jgi:hypothetical protein